MRLCAAIAVASALALDVEGAQPASGIRNVLMIVVDDLRPQMNTYGVKWMHSESHLPSAHAQLNPAAA
jgi:hypothetical protein